MNRPNQPPPNPPPLPPQLQQPIRPHCLSTSCNRHPKEKFTGFCPSCLCEHLTVLEHNSSSFIRKPSTSSTTAASLKVIFRPLATTHSANHPRLSSFSAFQPKLRRTKSLPTLKNEGISRAFEPQRRSCDIMARNTFFSFFNQDEKHKIPKKEREVETCNLTSSFIVQENEEDIITVIDEIKVTKSPEAQETNIENRVQEITEEEPKIEFKADMELKETLKGMKDHMDLDPQAKKSSNCNLKGIFRFIASIFKKKLKNGGKSR